MGRVFLVVLSTLICDRLDAQVASGREFQDFFHKKMQEIVHRIYAAGLNGTIAAYSSDSLAAVYPLEEVKKQGCVLHVEKTTDDRDTAFYEFFKEDNLLPDMGILYGIGRTGSNGIALSPSGIGIFYEEKYPNGLKLQMPLFYASYPEVEQKLLSTGERDYLAAYSMYDLFDQHSLPVGTSEYNLHNSWFNFNDLGIYRSSCRVGENILGAYLYEYLQINLLWREVPMYDKKGILVSKAEFNKKHGRLDTVQVWLPGDSPLFQGDTIYLEPPRSFDSVAFGYVKGEPQLWIYQRVPKTNKWSEYVIKPENARASLPTNFYSWLDIFYKEYFHP